MKKTTDSQISFEKKNKKQSWKYHNFDFKLYYKVAVNKKGMVLA